MNEYDEYRMQIEGQKEMTKAQSEESMKQYLPTLHQQMQDSQAVIINEINPRKVVEEVILILEGKSKDEYGNVVSLEDPYINKNGLNMIKILMRGVVNQNTTMSALNGKEINRLMIYLSENLAEDLAVNWKHYGIKNRDSCDLIMNIILTNCYTALKRAEEKNEKGFLKGIAFENVNSNSSYKPKRGGTWDDIKSKLRL